ncbi:MAG: glycosyl hydrolase family 32 [Gemmatimonadetes bacterium]|nr:glycosyl hydrolase family 32 [Gemmatimonadota bacterium]MXX12613.1 glycosyl hydrolase family 32 [Gemmatimonadota bacterium]MYB57614.1 glycosyl hydrolase family 32 [Gemmatimonadota bacterium]MYD63828.1 glycosyl hydrolase family 32 [Gemmatimonadota bacterium]
MRSLYNGIVLSEDWPPRRTREDLLAFEPMRVPYLENPPELIPIDLGRQLFVDDFLIENTTLRRTFHRPQYWAGNPILKPEKRWEFTSRRPTAMAFSDGIFYDAEEGIFRMWYRAGNTTCIAISEDGMHWERPELDFMPGTNIICLSGSRDSSTVWPDPDCEGADARYKMFVFHRDPWRASVYLSPDGLKWDFKAWTGTTGDRSTMFYNPFRKVWVYSIRDHIRGSGRSSYPENPLRRSRRYREHSDFVAGAAWRDGEPTWWIGADRLDGHHELAPDIQPELYNLDAVAYESIMLGLFSIWRYQPADRPKINEVLFGFSRDGFHWDRPCREAMMGISDGKTNWNWGNVQSAGGCCLVVGDQLYFYVSGRNYGEGETRLETMSMGLAMMRRDGFAAMEADSDTGELTTRPVRFDGKFLFVNAVVDVGELRVQVLDKSGKIIAPFTFENCTPLREDGTCQAVSWGRATDLSAISNREVRFQFRLSNGSLYAFWVTSDRLGSSGGYLGGGAPGASGFRDLPR